MGRKRKGVNTINEPYCLDYTLLVSRGYLLKGQGTSKETITWYKQGRIAEQAVIEAHCGPDPSKRYLTLSFCVSEPDGNLLVRKQIIELVEIESNLGKGTLTYFQCPVTGRKCRKLYKFEDGINWQCRAAFEERLYYPLQLCSKMNSYQARKILYDNLLEKARKGRFMISHKGKFTKRSLRIRGLVEKSNEMNYLMLSAAAMPLKLRRLFNETIDKLTAQEMLSIERDF
jgi:hypothetical protein